MKNNKDKIVNVSKVGKDKILEEVKNLKSGSLEIELSNDKSILLIGDEDKGFTLTKFIGNDVYYYDDKTKSWKLFLPFEE